MSSPDLAPNEWFELAAKWYVDQHQGCPWCERSNQLYKRQRGPANEYHCGGCDFYVCHDSESNRFYMFPGAKQPVATTMHNQAALTKAAECHGGAGLNR